MTTPHILGGYRVLEKLGEGGVGEVFRGIDLTLEREVAIKSLRPELARRDDIVERFRAEAKTLARLNHPNIATLYSFGEQHDYVFMAMEFVKGQTCEGFVSPTRPASWELATAVVCQALQGVAYAHSLGIIHRDLKPANLMVTESGAVKVMDFGIARLLGTPHTTRVGYFVGTPQYTAPELFRGQEADARTDIYALGVVLYELLTGCLPFPDTNDYDLMKAHMETTPTLPPHLARHIPAELEAVLLQALAKSPGERFQAADAFRVALEHGRRAASLSSSAPGPSLLSLVRAHGNAPVLGMTEEGAAQSHTSRLPRTSGGTAWKRYVGVAAPLLLFGTTLALAPLRPTTRPVKAVMAPTLPLPRAMEKPFISPPLPEERFTHAPGPAVTPPAPPPVASIVDAPRENPRRETSPKVRRPTPRKKAAGRERHSQGRWVFKK